MSLNTDQAMNLANILLSSMKDNEDFMLFWNEVYVDSFSTTSERTKNAFMEVAYNGFMAGVHHQMLQSR